MELLGVGPLEFVLIVLIALIVVGPRDLSKTARSAGRFLNRLYKSDTWRAVTQASRNLRTLPNRLAREAELEDLREARRELETIGREASRETREAGAGLKAWTTPGPRQSPPKEPAAPAPPEPPAASEPPEPPAEPAPPKT